MARDRVQHLSNELYKAKTERDAAVAKWDEVATELKDTIAQQSKAVEERDKALSQLSDASDRIAALEKEGERLKFEVAHLQKELEEVRATARPAEPSNLDSGDSAAAIALLNEGLELRPNAGGAIKAKIRDALQLLGSG